MKRIYIYIHTDSQQGGAQEVEIFLLHLLLLLLSQVSFGDIQTSRLTGCRNEAVFFLGGGVIDGGKLKIYI